MFVSARIDEGGYQNVSNAAGVPVAIQISGTITDDQYGIYRGTCSIEGPALAALPPADPETEGQPNDPRYVAIMAYVARWVKATHAEWVAVEAAKPTIVAKPAEETAQLPELTPELLDQLAPD